MSATYDQLREVLELMAKYHESYPTCVGNHSLSAAQWLIVLRQELNRGNTQWSPMELSAALHSRMVLDLDSRYRLYIYRDRKPHGFVVLRAQPRKPIVEVAQPKRKSRYERPWVI